MPGWGHDWPKSDQGPQTDARQLILDLAAVHNLKVQIEPWAQGDPRRKLAYAKVAAAHERLIDLVGQS